MEKLFISCPMRARTAEHEVVILRDDATDESEKCVAGIDHVVRNYDQTDFVIQFIHVFGTLVQIYDAAVCILHLGVYLVK